MDSSEIKIFEHNVDDMIHAGGNQYTPNDFSDLLCLAVSTHITKWIVLQKQQDSLQRLNKGTSLTRQPRQGFFKRG